MDGQPSPYPPAGYPTQPAMEQPQSLRIAVVLMYVGAVFGLLGIVATFVQSDEIEEMAVEIAEETSSSSYRPDPDAIATQSRVSGVLGGLLGIGLWIWMAVMNGQGKTWARTTGTVFGCLHVGSVAITIPLTASLFPVPTLSIVLSVITATLAVVIMILMYRPDASAYYQVMSRRPAPYQPYGYG
jgi:hypothetical protein